MAIASTLSSLSVSSYCKDFSSKKIYLIIRRKFETDRPFGRGKIQDVLEMFTLEDISTIETVRDLYNSILLKTT